MLEVLNRYAHGLVAIPVIVACRAHGLFDLLEKEGALDAAALAARTSANEGNLRVALRLLESIDWIDRDASGSYAITPAASERDRIPSRAVELLTFDFRAWLRGVEDGPASALPVGILDESGRHALTPRSLVSDFLDGLVVAPLMVAMHRERLFDLAAIRESARESIVRWLAARDYATPSGAFTEAGRYLFDRIWNTATVLSYAPMLARLDELLFGSARAVFARAADGAETHVDRAMNVEACGFQHEKFFTDADEIVLSIFDRQPLSAQPRYVVDMGCGDGSLLRRIYEVVRDRSARGKALDALPLTMIGVDYAAASLAATRRTLEAGAVPHFVLQGDIGDPARLVRDLRSLGVTSPDEVLHVRSFLDHDRPYIPPTEPPTEPPIKPGERSSSLDGVWTDEDGRAIDPHDMERSLVEHLRRWSDVLGESGLLLLEVHSLPPSSVRRYLDQSESLHFDAYHGFSHQHLVAADAFLLAAAEAGLFPRADRARRYPRSLPFTRITLNHFERRPYRVRRARQSDLAAVVQLEESGWPEALRQSEKVLGERLARGTSFVIEREERVVGVVHTQRIASIDAVRSTTHDPDGAVVQILGLNILPEARRFGLGDALLTFVLEMARVQNGVTAIVGVTRCRDFRGGSLAAYVAARDERGLPLDANLRFHASHGAAIGPLIPRFRPEDRANEGFGVLVQYDVHPAGVEPRLRRAPISFDVAAEVEDAIHRVIEISDVPRDQPLMEMGLDSMALMELRAILEERLGVTLGATFFFKHPTIASVIAALTEGDSRISSRPEADSPSPIAVVAMAYRFPGAESHDLWSLLSEGRHAITDAPRDRWLWPEGVPPMRGGFLSRIDEFDAAFFRVPPAKAELMDPQQRMLLELSWELLERGRYRPSDLAGRACGVFIGACHFEYREALASVATRGDGHLPTGTFASMLSNRISYFYDVTGPSVTIDTACSSSLVAVHEAVKALRSGECEMAIVGGVNLICSALNTLSFQKAGMLSPDGVCRTFDASANGYVRGEGGALLLLVPLARALANGDEILGVIRGSAVNHGGAASSLTAPNPRAQSDLIVRAMRDAGVVPSTISYIEVHGTATPLGDPIEVEGLQDAFRRAADEMHDAWPGETWCSLGSIKTNIGHLEGAAGVAGLIKVLLSLREGAIPPTLHFERLNPSIALDGSPFRIADRLQPWHAASPRRAGVSSFGFGGANAHVIVEEAPARAQCEDSPAPPPLPTYRFARTRFWIPSRRISVRGDERWFADHVVGGRAVAPGVFFLDAVRRVLGREAVRFENIAWTAPLESAAELTLTTDGNAFEIAPYVRGKFGDPSRYETLSLDPRGVRVNDAYAHLAKLGCRYGPALRTIEELWRDGGEALARVRSDDPIALLDGCLQTALTLLDEECVQTLVVSIDRFDFLRDLPAECRVRARRRESRFDIDVCDTRGERLVAIEGMRVASIHGPAAFRPCWIAEPLPPAAPADLLLATDDVTSEVIALARDLGIADIAPLSRADVGGHRTIFVVVSGGLDAAAERLRAWHFVRFLQQLDRTPRTIAVITRGTPAGATLVGIALAAARELPALTIGAVDLPPDETAIPAIVNGSIVQVRDGLRYRRALEPVTLPPCHPERSEGPGWLGGTTSDPTGDSRLRRNDLGSEIASSVPVPSAPPTQVPRSARDDRAVRERGTYLVIGGARGVGLETAVWLARNGAARLIIAGRSPLDDDIAARCERIRRAGAEYRYERCDATDAVALRALFARGAIDGVVHSAMTLRDVSLAAMTRDDLDAALAPKVDATLALAAAVRGMPLDWIVLHSSIMSFWGNAGQANYTAASAFQDAVAGTFGEVPVKVINWGYWGESGSVASDSYRKRLAAAGVLPMASAEALAAFGAALASPLPQIVLVRANASARALLGVVERLSVAERDGLLDAYCSSRIAALGLRREEVVPRYQRLFDALMFAAQSAGERSRADARNELAERCLELLPRVLRGEIAPQQVLFPEGSTRLVEPVYRDPFNRETAAAVERCLREKLRDGRRVTILEIGAGTGGTTDAVVDRLAPFGDRIDYCFTDVSPSFVNRAKERFAQPWMRFHTFDIEQRGDVAPRIDEQFDLIIGANVVHATRSLRDTLRNLERALKPDGVLVLQEVTSFRPFHAVSFGLLDGWWRFEDGDRRHPHAPIASVAQWRSVLADEGFAIEAVVEGSLQAVLVARSGRGQGSRPSVPATVSGGEEGYVRRIVGEVLKIDGGSIDPDSPLGDYGVDSIVNLELLARFERDMGHLPATLLFEHLTLRSLADYFAEHHAGAGRSEMGGRPEPRNEDIAIIGISGRFPRSPDLDAFWQNLREGRDCIADARSRWRGASGWGGFLEDADCFDPRLFGIAPREAARIDPQERLMLESAWSAMEDAGYTRKDLSALGPVGVFAGVMHASYALLAATGGAPEESQASYWSIANRISFVLNLRGPSLAVDTACSSSLTALHLACASIRGGESAAAFVGGVNLILHPAHLDLLANLNMLSADGRCKSFGVGADGFAAGEGVCCVLLKPLRTAVADGDTIHAVIKGSAANAGGRTGGYTVPNPTAQADVIEQALRHSGVDPMTISYVEAHGTGTSLGDPIEIRGLAKAIGGACAIGSVKSNIGHLESAAGLAGVMKVVLQMKHRTLVPTLHADDLNPKLELAATPFAIQRALAPWSASPMRAGVSSFGAGGSNVHVVLEEAPARSRAQSDAPVPHAIVLSARDEEALAARARQLLDVLGRPDAPALCDVAFTLRVGREPMDVRFACIATTLAELRDKLAAFLAGTFAGETIDGIAARDGQRVPLPTYPFARERYWLRGHRYAGLQIEPDSPLLRSHRIDGRAVLSGVAYVDLALAAATRLFPESSFAIERIAWPEPLAIGSAPPELAFAIEGNRERCEIAISAESTTHALVTLVARELSSPPHASMPDVRGEVLGADEIRALSRARGLTCDDDLVTLREIRHDGGELLAEIALPKGELAALDRYIVHPLLLEGAMNALAVLAWSESDQPLVSFAAEDIEIFSPPGERVLAHIERIDPLRYRLALLDERGRLLLRFGSVALRTTVGGRWSAVDGGSLLVPSGECVRPAPCFRVTWRPSLQVVEWPSRRESVISTAITPGRPDDSETRRLRTPGGEIFRAEDTEESLFALHRLMRSRPADRPLHLEIAADDAAKPYVAAQSALARSIARERRAWRISTPLDPVLRPIELPPGESPFRDGGTYVIAGGAGTIGFDLTLHLASRHRARVFWLGRRAPGEEIRAKQDRVRAAGGEAIYLRADITRADEVAAAIAGIGEIHGVVQAALVLQTRAIDELTPEALRESLDPKVRGTMNLLRAVSERALDFFLICSSIQSFTTDARQAAYAAGCAFTDAFAVAAAEAGGGDAARPAGEDAGGPIEAIAPRFPIKVVNLGYWRGGPLDSPALEQHIVSLGHRLLDPPAAIEAIARFLRSDECQIAIVDAPLFPPFDEPPPPREPSRTPEFEAYVRARVARALRELDGQRIVALPKYRRLLEALRSIARDGDVAAPSHPDLAPWIRLLDAGLPRLGEIVGGARSAPEVLLPSGSLELVEGVYRGQTVADYFQRQTAWAVRRFVESRASHVEIIEIGGGTGATTRFILDALGPFADRVRYTFTDVSRAFLKAAQGWIGDAALATLDLERDVREQGFDLYDVVVAANVVHATRDLRRSLRNLKQLLRPGGWLVLNEATETQDVLTATFGLLDGWWLFGDAENRLPHAPLAGEETWTRLLREEGFGPVFVSSEHDLGQRVLVAEGGSGGGERSRASRSSLSSRSVRLDEGGQDRRAPDQIEDTVARCAAEVLEMRVGDVPRETPFADYGMDSILGIEMVDRIRAALGIALDATAIFDYPSVRKLAQHIGAPRIEVETEEDETAHDAIAIIGFSGRFPGAANTAEYWRNLAAGVSSIREVPPERWPADESACRWGGFLDDVDAFDPLFFNISGTEAQAMDPQQRLFLMECWRALEDAGYPPSRLAERRCGVFAGANDGDYRRLLEQAGAQRGPQWLTGNDSAILAARIAYFLDLKGPTLSINAACASSLTAVHLACRAIESGDADLMLAGGVYIGATPDFHIQAGGMGMLSPTGACHAFDARANGFVPGEGVGVVVLKRLSAALRDGDAVHGVIRGSAVNQDGRTNGITAPSARAQRDVELAVYRGASIDPSTIQYVEMHGTGTPLGDPVEVRALTEAFRELTDRKRFCAIGSVKTNIGHATLAAGIAGLIKVLLALRHRAIPPSLGYEAPNPRIGFDDGPFFVNTELREWRTQDGMPRRAAVSAFGFNGSNCHLVIEEAPAPNGREELRGPVLVPISARDADALERRIADLAKWIRDERPALADLAFTLQQRRERFECRTEFVVSSIDELLDALERPDERCGTEAPLPVTAGRILPLPPYPFAKGRYWVREGGLGSPARPGPSLTLGMTRGEDHRVLGEVVLPGAASIEILASRVALPRRFSVAWHRPLIVGEEQTINATIRDDGFEIRGCDGVHASGAVAPLTGAEETLPLDSIRARCGRVIDPDAVYAKLRASGIHHGDSFRTLLSLRAGDDEAVGTIAGGSATTVIDGAFQALAGLTLDDAEPLMPFAVEQLDIFASLPPRVVAHARRRAALRFDLDIAAEDGALLMRFRGLAFRPAKRAVRDGSFVPCWVPSPRPLSPPPGCRRLVVRGVEDLAGDRPDEVCFVGALEPHAWNDAERAQKQGIVALFELVKTMIRLRWHEEPLRLVVVTREGQPLASALHGFARSLAKELYRWRIVSIEIDHDRDLDRILAGEEGLADGALVAYRGGVRHALSMEPLVLGQAPSRFRRGGVYLIVGGAGALGRQLARYLVETYDARVMLTGRRDLDDPNYFRADVTREAELCDAIRTTIDLHGALHGVIHSALALGDRTIENMDAEALQRVLAPKVQGSLALWNALHATGAAANLDFLLFFSSAQSFLGNAGQSNYAAASAAQDAIALELAKRAWFPVKVVNWGDWGSSGAAQSPRVREQIARAGGIAIRAEDGFEALERFLASDLLQLVHVRGEAHLIERLAPTASKDRTMPVIAGGERTRTVEWLKQLFAASLNIPVEQIDSRATFERYGVDSLAVLDLNRRIEEVVGKIPSTLLFERNTIQSLAEYLSESAGRAEAGPERSKPVRESDIAIIGIAGRYPMAADLDAFWAQLREGRGGIREIPRHRWDAIVGVHGSAIGSRWGGFLDDIDRFDPLFFNIAPGEAEMMDPQERLFLETAWAALEDAGYTRRALTERDPRVGVFVGVMSSGYEALAAHAWAHGANTGAYSAYWSIANRVSYHFDLRGPSLAIDTACSSSLTAIHLACESIRRGGCRTAIAGGVNLIVHPMHYARLSAKGMLAADGRCKAFGDGADGFVDGEGVGAVLLKPLADALRDGDHVHAVIKASAINAGGKTAGYTVPNPIAQTEVIASALREADVDPATIGYVEAHGTGTSLGDPIEVRALARAWGAVQTRCPIGSVKSNIGHLESAAGIAGLTKVVLQIEHRTLVPTLHAEVLNPRIDFEECPLTVQRETAPWTERLRAAVSSFGAGGANAHLIVEAFDSAPAWDGRACPPQIIVLSAQNEDRLRARAEQLLRALPDDLAAVAYTLQTGREAMRERLAFVARDREDARSMLRRFLDGDASAVVRGSVVVREDDGREPLRGGSPELIAAAWAAGHPVEWPRAGRRTPLPAYPFAGERYWLRIPEGGDASDAPVRRGETLAFRAIAGPEEANGAREIRIGGSLDDPEGFIAEALTALTEAARGCTKPTRFALRGDAHNPLFGALHGWARTVEVELPHVAFASPRLSFEDVPLTRGSAFRERGVYAITGASGGIGRQLAEYLETRYRARIIRLGRSLGVDVTDRDAVRRAIEEGRRAHGVIHGVIHAAGVVDDGLALSKSAEQRWRVIAPKVMGAIHLDEATRGDALDFFVLFSSLVAFFGNAGQSDYAYGSRFLHEFAVRRGGTTRAIAWPLWERGGMHMPPERIAALRDATGLEPLPSPAALRVLEDAIASGERELLIAHGDAERIRAFMGPKRTGELREFLAGIIAETLKMPVERLDPSTSFQHFGIDSVWMLRILARLEEHFGPLPKTLFFEYQNLGELTSYFDAHEFALPSARNEVSAGRSEGPKPGPIAIIGVAGRYPDADDLDEFWSNLVSGRDCIREIPSDRWGLDAYPPPDPSTPERRYSRWGGFLREVDRFDPRFFSITPRDAKEMDPQERLFLEVAWETVENAGYSPASIARLCENEVGVFAGVMWGEYQLHGVNRSRALNASFAGIANRISYVFDWHGPSLAIDTMCSSSLTSLHLACESLRRGECRMALAGGVNVSIHPNKYLLIGQNQFASSDGRCRSFGEGGDGYVPGEGVGAVLLKPLDDAIADGDYIHGVILGSAINHGGQSTGYTVPNPKAQAAVIRRALAVADVDPRTIGYVETHGTGTPLGDPVEIRGLAGALEGARQVPIGSVKSNVGHLESAAGIAALTKVLLQLRHRTFAPSLHADRLNANIDWDRIPFFVQRESAPWRERLRAAVSSFGAGGSNAHLIVEAWESARDESSRPSDSPQIIVLSARNGERLVEYVRRLLAWLPRCDAPLADIAFTLQTGRKAMAERLGLVARDRDDLAARLESWLRGERVDAADPLLQRWLAGETVDWSALHRAPRRRVPLPSYPFARERYWAMPASTAETMPSETRFSPALPIVRDHRVNGSPMVAGVVQLALARAAAGANVRLRDVAWLRPLVIERDKAVRVRVADQRFEVVADGVVHTTGRLEAHDGSADRVEDIDAIRRRCTRLVPSCYEEFRKRGIEYGPLFQCIEELRAGDDEALALLRASDSRALLDGALQCVLGLDGVSSLLSVPFALGGFTVHRELPSRALAWARRGGRDSYRIDLLDETGTVCATFDDFVVRSVAPPEPLTMLEPVWRAAVAMPHSNADAPRLVIGSGPLASQLRNGDASDANAIFFLADRGAAVLMDVAQDLERRARLQSPLSLVVVTNRVQRVLDGETVTPLGSDAIGFALALQKEYSRLHVACVDVALRDDGTLSHADLRALLAGSDTVIAAIRNGRRYIRSLEPVEFAPAAPPWRREGVYLIAGGAGGIGAALAEHLAGRAAARIALLGRRPSGASVDALLAKIESLGGRALYAQADITDPSAVAEAVARIHDAFGPIHGVFQSALALDDRPLTRLDRESLRTAMDPKARGTEVLHEATRSEPLDFFVAFSSTQALTGNAGQANYAAACTYQDAFVRAIGGISINWGFWGSVGRVANDAYRRQMARIGVHSIEVAEGMQALETILASGRKQVAAVKAAPRALVELGVVAGEENGLALLEQFSTALLRRTIPPEAFDTALPKFRRTCDALRAVLARTGDSPHPALRATLSPLRGERGTRVEEHPLSPSSLRGERGARVEEHLLSPSSLRGERGTRAP